MKRGQLAHLDGNPSNTALDNLAYLCLPHHDEYDSTTSQSKGLTINEVKLYRTRLYEAVDQMRQGSIAGRWPADLEVPELTYSRFIDPTRGIFTQGIQFIDKDPSGQDGYPLLYLSVYFKTSRFFGDPTPSDEKWLYLEAHMRPAFSLRIQVRAWTNRDILEFWEFLHSPESEFVRGYDLHGPIPNSNGKHSRDSLLVWRENNTNRLMMSTFTATHAGIAVHARFSPVVALAFAQYLEKVGFTKPIE
jgi:hypothetical protein